MADGDLLRAEEIEKKMTATWYNRWAAVRRAKGEAAKVKALRNAEQRALTGK